MVRRHGWQLPAHAFQVVAITAFFLLAVAFYVFLAPFLGSGYGEFTAIVVYSLLAVTVFLLYVRCSAIDPADPGVFSKFLPSSSKSDLKPSADSTMSVSSSPFPFHPKAPARWDGSVSSDSPISFASQLCLLCSFLVRPDNCRGRSPPQQPVADEDILFCTLCNAEVRKHSKHCRSCDKCVDGFDHHCRWLNNCVGRRNYASFVALMSTSLLLLTLQWGIGTAVLVRCFVDRSAIEHQIVDKLGNSFSRPPFATLVAISAVVSFVSSIPLGELLFFHIILIRKGISTYAYVIAMRSQAEVQGDSIEGDIPSVPSTPASSTATGLSGSSSVGLHNRGAWCTPPKIFVEHQDEVVPHLGPGRVPSTVDPDALDNAVGREMRLQKRPVRISAWKLARLNADDAARAAAKATENSSVLRYLGGREPGKIEIDYSSSGNLSRVSSASNDYGAATVRAEAHDETSSQSVWAASLRSRGDWNSALELSRSDANSPSHAAKESIWRKAEPPSSLVLTPGLEATPVSLMVVASSKLPKHSTGRPSDMPGSTTFAAGSGSWVDLTAVSDGYEASSGESADDSTPQMQHGLGKPREAVIKGSQKTAGIWSDSIPIRSALGASRLDKVGRPFGNSIFSRSKLAWPDPSASPPVSDDMVSSDLASGNISSSQASPSRPGMSSASPGFSQAPSYTDTLRFNGTCIFYGGPLTLNPKLPVEREYAPSLPSKISSKQDALQMEVTSEAPSENRPRPVLMRSQSPVFEPHGMHNVSSLQGPPGSW